MQRQQKRRPVLLKAAVSLAAAAAVICLTVLGSTFLFSQSDNEFVLRAYAMEVGADGSIVRREVDLRSESYHWSTYNDGSLFYVNVNLKCEGVNIRNVVFHVDDGFLQSNTSQSKTVK